MANSLSFDCHNKEVLKMLLNRSASSFLALHLLLIPYAKAADVMPACFFNWAELAAPELISATVEPQTIPYGDFTIRYYDKSANALLLDNSDKQVYFYDLSGYLSGNEALAISQESVERNITFKLRRYMPSESVAAGEVALYAENRLIESFSVPLSDTGSYPQWAEYVSFSVSLQSNKLLSSIYFKSVNGGLVEVSEVLVDGVPLSARESNLNNDFGGSNNLYWIGGSPGYTYFDNPMSAVSSFQNVGYTEYWIKRSGCGDVNFETPVLSTSYENVHRNEFFPTEPPVSEDPYFQASSYVLADFFGNGEMTMLTSDLAPYAYQTDSEIRDGKIRFYSQDEDINTWVEVTDLLLDDDTGCILARKILIGDFNNDLKPDAFFLCTGTDVVNVTGERDRGEPGGNRILLSNANGKYENRVVSNGYPFTYSHGGAAFDYNGDGNLDVLATDLISGEWVGGNFIKNDERYGYPYLLLGNGNGNFTVDNSISELFGNCCIYSLEVLDIDEDGDQDIWWQDASTDNEETVVFLNENGNFSKDNKLLLPLDDEFNHALDVVKIGRNLYTIYIKLDYSKREYYWGNAIQKLNLDTMDAELIYSHTGLYENECNKKFPTTWFYWLYNDGDAITPRNTCYGISVPIN